MRNLLLTVAVLTTVAFSLSAFADEVDFNRDMRPILSDRCFACHGPDAETVEADLRLDLEPSAKEYAIVPGEPQDSEVYLRVSSTDADLQMPPPESKLSLSQDEIETIRRWIEQGAPYDEHWAFEPLPDSVAVPELKDTSWVKQPIDALVLAKLESLNLKPSQEAQRWRWLRRVTFDLTGLPPTAEEIEAFENDTSDATYENVVDRLLRSPQFGEQMAVAWLDAARYADSYGYQSDKLNTQWPYRDWVVRALNDNLPYDEFLTWQLAGDLLDNPTRDQKLATAFNRLHRLNNEGGAVFEEWRVENVADRVHTFGTAVLGLTMECARCHDHKYDPISQRDYYSLFAFFNSIDENGVYDNSEKVPAPSLLLPTDTQAAALQQARRSLKEAEDAYHQAVADAERRFQQRAAADDSLPDIPDLVRALSFDIPYDAALKELYYTGTGDRSQTEPLTTVDVSSAPSPRLEPARSADGAQLSVPPEHSPPRLAVRLDGERGIVMPGVEPFDRWTPFSLVITLREVKRVATPAVIAQVSRGQLAFNGWDLIIADGFVESRMYREWPGNAIGVRTKQRIPADQWHQIAVTYDGSSKAAGLKLYLNGKQLDTEIVRDQVKKRAMVEVMHGGTLSIGQRFRDRGLDGGLVDDVSVFTRALTSTEIAHLATGKPINPTVEYFASAIDEAAREALAELTDARKALVMAEEIVQEIPIMEELPEPLPAHVLARGQYDAPTSVRTLVTRETPAFLLPLPTDAPRDRLGLAAWVTDPSHPLTARVAVNRVWGNFFAAPLVRTPEDFGSQGQLPSHPELLDWLARDFISHGWDLKRLCKQIVLSATYRQDSKAAPQALAADPENRWLARGPAYRLSAEQIRDTALAAGGLLNPQQGGPPVSPYQPGDDLWRENNGMSPPYQQSVGRALYRRSLYSVWKRTAPLPNMMAFDTGTREVCTVRRDRTNTPLQALVLLNDVQFVEACRHLAETALEQEQTDEARIVHAFVSLAGRKPDEKELQALLELLGDEHRYYEENIAEANKLISIGESEPNTKLGAQQLAALTTVCQAILNLDATIWKR